MFQAGVAVIECDAAIESLVDLHFGAGEAEAACLLGNLKAAALPLHDVVVANDAFMDEAADAVESFRSRAPGGVQFRGAAGRNGDCSRR